jgi:hypothetical protein
MKKIKTRGPSPELDALALVFIRNGVPLQILIDGIFGDAELIVKAEPFGCPNAKTLAKGDVALKRGAARNFSIKVTKDGCAAWFILRSKDEALKNYFYVGTMGLFGCDMNMAPATELKAGIDWLINSFVFSPT